MSSKKNKVLEMSSKEKDALDIVKISERSLHRVAKQNAAVIESLTNALENVDKTLTPDIIAQIRKDINYFSLVNYYISRALSYLPNDPFQRAAVLHEHFKFLERFSC